MQILIHCQNFNNRHILKMESVDTASPLSKNILVFGTLDYRDQIQSQYTAYIHIFPNWAKSMKIQHSCWIIYISSLENIAMRV